MDDSVKKSLEKKSNVALIVKTALSITADIRTQKELIWEQYKNAKPLKFKNKEDLAQKAYERAEEHDFKDSKNEQITVQGLINMIGRFSYDVKKNKPGWWYSFEIDDTTHLMIKKKYD